MCYVDICFFFSLVYYGDIIGNGEFLHICLPVLRVTDRVTVVAYYQHTCILFSFVFLSMDTSVVFGVVELLKMSEQVSKIGKNH